MGRDYRPATWLLHVRVLSWSKGDAIDKLLSGITPELGATTEDSIRLDGKRASKILVIDDRLLRSLEPA